MHPQADFAYGGRIDAIAVADRNDGIISGCSTTPQA
jgi:hypothetical protein